MHRIFFALLAVSLFWIIVGNTTTVYGCVWSNSVSAATDDVSDTIITRTGTYTSCGTRMYWQDSFTRTASNNGMYYLRFKYVGCTVYNRYWSEDYSAGNYTNSGSECCGGTKEIIISKSSWNGRYLWSNMKGEATYQNCGSESPER